MQLKLLDRYKDKVEFSDKKPPIFERCKALFGATWENTTFAYSPAIHDINPKELREDIIVHEMVHIKRQDGDPHLWWEKYLTDDTFRLNEEIVAYRRQYFWLKDNKKIDRNELYRYARSWALNLSGAGYGYLTDYQTAFDRITK